MNQELIDKFNERLGVRVDFDIIDDYIISDSNILRPIIGHAFEYIVEDIVTRIGGKVLDKGGDTNLDLVIMDKDGKSYNVQAKTLRKEGIKEGVCFDISMHKTHGEERRPHNLFPIEWPCSKCPHDGGEFPDFLIIPHPQAGILIIPKSEIPECKTFPGHFADPAKFSWDSEWLNRWDLIGFEKYKGQSLERNSIPEQPILNKVCQLVKLTYEELLSVLLKPSNFRVIDMNLKGNIRNFVLARKLKNNGYELKKTEGKYSKYDLLVGNIRVQVKGVSKARTNSALNSLCIEVMGTHCKGAKRRYSQKQFDYLGIVIEPNYLNPELGLAMDTYHFCFVPVKALPLHYRNGYEWNTKDKLYDVASFMIVKRRGEVYLKPLNVYNKPPKFVNAKGDIIVRKPVHFRSNKLYKINEIPFEKQS